MAQKKKKGLIVDVERKCLSIDKWESFFVGCLAEQKKTYFRKSTTVTLFPTGDKTLFPSGVNTMLPCR